MPRTGSAPARDSSSCECQRIHASPLPHLAREGSRSSPRAAWLEWPSVRFTRTNSWRAPAVFVLSLSALALPPLPSLSHEDRNLLPPAARGLPFEKIAKEFLASHALSEKRPEEIEFDKILKSHFVQAQRGIVEVKSPAVDLENGS